MIEQTNATISKQKENFRYSPFETKLYPLNAKYLISNKQDSGITRRHLHYSHVPNRISSFETFHALVKKLFKKLSLNNYPLSQFMQRDGCHFQEQPTTNSCEQGASEFHQARHEIFILLAVLESGIRPSTPAVFDRNYLMIVS